MSSYINRAVDAEFSLAKIHDQIVSEVNRIVSRSRVLDAALIVLSRHHLMGEFANELCGDHEHIPAVATDGERP